MDNQCPQGLRHHLQGVRQCRRHLTKGIHRSPAVDPRAGTGREVAGAGMAIVVFGPRTMEMAMVVATVPQPYEAPLRPQLTGTTVAPTGGAIDRRRLGGCHDPSPKNDGCGACSHSYSLHRPWANTAASRPSNAAATNRDSTTATRVDRSLAPVARSLAMEWSALGLGPGEMATVARHPHRHRYRYR